MKIKNRFSSLHGRNSHIKLELYPSDDRRLIEAESHSARSLEYSDLSHKQLAQSVEQVAATLHRLSTPGTTVLCCTRLSIQGLVVLLSALRCGLRICPLDGESGSAYLENITQQLAPALCIIDDNLKAGLTGALPCQVIGMSACFASVHAVSSAQTRPHLLLHRKAELLTASSGSTGKAKIIRYDMQRFSAFMCFHDFLFRQFPDKSGRRVFGGPLVCTTPLFHLGGLALCLQAFMLGKTLFMLKEPHAEKLIGLVRSHGVQLMLMIPGMLRLVLREGALEHTCHSLRYCLTFGEAVDEKLVQELKHQTGMQLFSAYGMSECETGLGHARNTIVSGRAPAGNCGQHLFGDLNLCDESGQPADAGELWVRNSSVGPCYTDCSLNEQRYREGWFRTGDILRRDERGFYYYQGRADQMMIVNGKNIYPSEIETVLMQHPQVLRAKVVSLTRNDGSCCPAALLEPVGKAELSPADILDHFLQHGNAAGTPGWLEVCTSLPELANGKVDAMQCRAILEQSYRHFCSTGHGYLVTGNVLETVEKNLQGAKACEE